MNIEIIGFREELAVHFTELNLAWLKKYFVVEPIDHEVLSDPKRLIIDKGGFIFFATADKKIAGTFALIKTGGDEYELSKMAVDEDFQLLDALALIFVGGFQLLAAFGFGCQVLVVISRIQVNSLVPDLERLAHRDIQKVAIV